MAEPGGRWRDQDGLLAAALIEYEAGLCPGCGYPLAETTDPTSDPHHPDGTHKYESPYPARCFACDALESRTKDYAEADNPRALRFSTRKVARVAGRR